MDSNSPTTSGEKLINFPAMDSMVSEPSLASEPITIALSTSASTLVERPPSPDAQSVHSCSADSLLQEGMEALPAERFKPFLKSDQFLGQKTLSKRAKSFYKEQNEMIEAYQHIDKNEVVDKEEEEKKSKLARFVIYLSFIVNICLFGIKIYASVASFSLSVIASAVDSLLDLFSGSVVFLTTRIKNKQNIEKYPVGKGKIEPLGVVVFAAIMGTASLQIIREAGNKLGSSEVPPILAIGTIVVICCTIGSKTILYILCKCLAKSSASATALAQDHRNDVLTNSFGAVAYLLASNLNSLWWVDPVGAMLLACYIIFNWARTAAALVKNLMGHTAEPEFIQKITYLAATHSTSILAIDTVCAYYNGANFIVEIHIVLDRNLALKSVHDISEALSLRVEKLPQVERCFVHTDYEVGHRPDEEHSLNS